HRRPTSWIWLWSRTRSWTGTWLRWCPCEVRRFSGKEAFEDLRAEIRLRRILIGPNRHRHGVVAIVKLLFNGCDFVLHHEQKVAVHFVGHVVLFVVTNAPELAEDPGQRIGAGANNMANKLIRARIRMRQSQDWIGEFVNVVVSLDVDVRLGVGR